MKFLGIFFAISMALTATSAIFTKPGEVNADTYGSLDRGNLKLLDIEERIANGIEAKKGETPEFCYLSITFITKQVTCGCFLVDSNYVATSARCVVDCSEKAATNITVTFPQLSGADAVRSTQKFWVPDGLNGNKALGAFSELSEIPYTTIGANNIALIKLNNPLNISIDIKAAKIGSDTNITSFMMRMQAGNYKFRACGIGVIDDKGNKAKGVMCADMNYVEAAKCAETFDPMRNYTIPPGTMCLQWPDRTNNACVGDFGGPVYAYKTDSKGVIDIASQEIFCTLIGSPNLRTGSPCLDAHITVCTFLPGPVDPGWNPKAWATNIISPKPPPVDPSIPPANAPCSKTGIIRDSLGKFVKGVCVMPEAKSYINSIQRCRDFGMDLFRAESKDILDSFNQFYNTTYYVSNPLDFVWHNDVGNWIAGMVKSGTWQAVRGVQEFPMDVSFYRIIPKNVNNVPGDCMAMKRDAIGFCQMAYDCATTYLFICEYNSIL